MGGSGLHFSNELEVYTRSLNLSHVAPRVHAAAVAGKTYIWTLQQSNLKSMDGSKVGKLTVLVASQKMLTILPS